MHSDLIQIIDDNIKVGFNRWDIDAYRLFIKSKGLPEYPLEYDHEKDQYNLICPARFARILGLPDMVPDYGFMKPIDCLFDYQEYIVYKFALPLKRYAIWADTGMGKTIMALEIARQVKHKTGGRVLYIVPLNIISQTIDEAEKFYGESYHIERIKNREHLKKWCKGKTPEIGIINPEKFIPRKGQNETISECQYLSGVLLDEASILKSGAGRIKWALIKSCKGIEYKYTFTATPAPNELMEYASQGSFLEKLRSGDEIMWTYFVRDKEGNWKVRENAIEKFYKFMAGWSIYLKNPVNYGFKDNLKDLPDPLIKEYKIPLTDEQKEYLDQVPDRNGQLSILGASSEDTKLDMIKRIKFSEIAKGFMYDKKKEKNIIIPIKSNKPAFCADIAMNEMKAGKQVLIWTEFDEESRILHEEIQKRGCECELLTGKTQKAKRLEITEQFRKGNVASLITRSKLMGYGLNLQNCTVSIDSGFNDSEEQRYQRERRIYRYGQKKQVTFHYPYIPELEGVVYKNINQKRERIAQDVAIMEKYYIEAMKDMEVKNYAA